jgi:hypothetical protein
MNCAIHAATAGQAGISGVDNGVHANLGYVTDHQTKFLSVREIDVHAVIVTHALPRLIPNRDRKGVGAL